jgi:hypothetical protein
MPCSAASERMAHKTSELSPRLWCSGDTRAASAESAVGMRLLRYASVARSINRLISPGKPYGVPSQTKGIVCPNATTVPAGSLSKTWKASKAV